MMWGLNSLRTRYKASRSRMSARKLCVGRDLEPPLELLFNLEQVQLAEIEKAHCLGLKTADLPDQLRADRAARSGDQDPLAAEKAADHLRVEADLLPPHEVFQPHLPDGAHGDSALDELADLGDGAEPLARPVADFDKPPHLVSVGRWDRDQDLVELYGDLPDFVDGPEDGHAVDRAAPFPRVVIEETDGIVFEAGVVLDLP